SPSGGGRKRGSAPRREAPAVKPVSLRTHSWFSLLEGVDPPAALAEAAAQGYGAVALTDTNSVAGCVDFVEVCQRVGVRPLVGARRRAPPRRDDKKSGVVISYDDEGSIRLEAEYAVKHELGGVMAWEPSADDGKATLLTAIREVLRPKKKDR